MMDFVSKYYEALENNDIKTLNSFINKEEFSIRLYDEDVLYPNVDLKELSNKYNGVHTIKITEIIDNTIYYSFIMQNRMFDAKMVIDGNLIMRIYETKHIEKTRYLCIVSYDGSIYSGFQKQPDLRTIQGDIEKGLFYLFNEEITIHPSGRTDKGVHANNQVFHFDVNTNIPLSKMKEVINNYIPDSIYIKDIKVVPSVFHSRFDALKKEYLYVLQKTEYTPFLRNYVHFVKDINAEKLKHILNDVLGTHNFSAFTKFVDDKEMVRTIYEIRIEETTDQIKIYIVGSGFLRYMVRYIVGTALHILENNDSITFQELIEKEDSSLVKWKAPAAGLYLNNVVYNNL